MIGVAERATRAKAELVGEDGHQVLVVSFLVNVQQTLMEGFDVDVHNTALGVAHDADFMPEGQPLVTKKTADPMPRVEGERTIFGSMDDLALDTAILQGDIVEIRTEWPTFVSLR